MSVGKRVFSVLLAFFVGSGVWAQEAAENEVSVEDGGGNGQPVKVEEGEEGIAGENDGTPLTADTDPPLPPEPEPKKSIRTDTLSLSLTLSSLPEARASVTWDNTFALLQGEGPLTRGNNLRVRSGLDLTPVSVEGKAALRFTPIAFLYIDAGASAGSGWNASLFGSPIVGIGLNKTSNKADADGSAFDGLIGKAWGGLALQFDAAALWPGDWHHIVAQVYSEANYTFYTRAKDERDAWYHLSDDGENRNGWNYYGAYVLAYQMPLMLDMAGFMAEQEVYLTRPEGSEVWGDDIAYWTLSILAHLKFSSRWSLTATCQFATYRHWENDNDIKPEKFFQDRILIGDSYPQFSFAFYRVAVIADFKVW